MEAKIVREPKGGPDIILIDSRDREKRILLAGDFLSVRGYTARVVTLPEGCARLSALSDGERERVLAGGAPYICLPENEALSGADASAIAAKALQEIAL